jgi:hypothetical protein
MSFPGKLIEEGAIGRQEPSIQHELERDEDLERDLQAVGKSRFYKYRHTISYPKF